MRIRSIKPEFWTSEDIAALDWETRLLFIGLWSYVDDDGVGRDVERLIVAGLFPLEDDPRDTLATVSRGLRTLSDRGLITRYRVDERPYLHITAWDDHQRIDRPGKSRYPAPTCGNAETREAPADPRDTLATPSRLEQGNRGTGEQGIPPTAGRADAPTATRSANGTQPVDATDQRASRIVKRTSARRNPDPIPELPEPAGSESTTPTAQTVTGAWIDALRATGTEPSRSMIGQVSRSAKELLDAGNDPSRVLDAARHAGTRGFVTIDRELAAMGGKPRLVAFPGRGSTGPYASNPNVPEAW